MQLARLRRLFSLTAAMTVVAALLATSATTLTATAAHAATSADCHEVLMLGARGSGQPQDGNADDNYTGLGPQVQTAYNGLAAPLSGHRTLQALAVDYPALGVEQLYDQRNYFNGLDQGVQNALATLYSRATPCPEERIVLAGYSQGAMVMHRVLNELDATKSPILSRVDAAILIADGDRVSNDRTAFYGSASTKAEGVGLKLRKVSGSSTQKFNAAVGSKVLSICNNNDPVCDSTGKPTDLIWKYVHTGYTGTPPVQDAGVEAARTVLSTPAARPRAASLSGVVGQAFRYQYTADVLSGFSLEWRLAAGALPPGITLGGTGLITGTPTTVGAWTAQLQVRGVILGVTGGWAPATVQFAVAAPSTRQPFVANHTSGPRGFWTYANSPSPCPAAPAGYSAAILAYVSDGSWSMSSASQGPIWLGTHNLEVGTHAVHITCRQVPTNTFPTGAEANLLPILASYPDISLTVTSDWMPLSVTPMTVSAGQTLTLSGTYPVGDGSGVATAYINGQTGYPNGVKGTSAHLAADGSATTTLVMPSGTPSRLGVSIGVEYASGWGLDSALVFVNVV